MTAVRQLKPKAAARPKSRTVTVVLGGDYAGWECTARADFPVRWISELDASDMGSFALFMDRIIVSHNMPDSNDEIAVSALDVDPFDGLMKMCDAVVEELGNLPKR